MFTRYWFAIKVHPTELAIALQVQNVPFLLPNVQQKYEMQKLIMQLPNEPFCVSTCRLTGLFYALICMKRYFGTLSVFNASNK